jgi:Protein of unknown function, DUF547
MITFVRRTILASMVFALTVHPAAADMKAANAALGKLLTKYLTTRGVRYAAWRANGDDLKRISEVVMIYRTTDLKALEPNERKALLINIYNSKVLETVLLHNPSGSFRALSKGPSDNEIFKRNVIALEGKPISFNGLEKRIREEFKDPRIHFAINCASRSCPPVRGEPYSAERLDAQLDDATRAFLASPAGVIVSSSGRHTTLAASRIFEWYEDDFKASGGIMKFIATYGPEEAAQTASSGKAKLEFQPYDWGLNVSN